MKYPLYTLYTSIILVFLGTALCLKKFDYFHASVIFVGLTSVVHHSRSTATQWWYNDHIAWLDRLAVFHMFLIGTCYERSSSRWWLTMVLCGLVYLSTIVATHKSECHTCMHLIFLLYLLHRLTLTNI